MIVEGRVWKLGDGVEATDILPARYDELQAKNLWDECAAHLLEDIAPDYAKAGQPGDIVIAGKQLGVGHAHYYRAAIFASRAAKLGGIFAESVVDLFLRGSIDQGVAVWRIPEISTFAETGDLLHIDLQAGKAINRTQDRTMDFKPVHPAVLEILAAGSAFEWAKAKALHRSNNESAASGAVS